MSGIKNMSSIAPKPILSGEKKMAGSDAKPHWQQQALQWLALIVSLASCFVALATTLSVMPFLGIYRFNGIHIIDLVHFIPWVVRLLGAMLGLVLGIRAKCARGGKIAIVLSTVSIILEAAALSLMMYKFSKGWGAL